MGNGPFIDGLPIKNGDFSMAMLNNQMVNLNVHNFLNDLVRCAMVKS